MTKRGAAKQVVLWLGLLMCVYALWRSRMLMTDAVGRAGIMGWACVACLLVGGWGFAVVAWRWYLLAYTGQVPSWRAAMRQMGLLLIGKYIPGGVFGFLARLYDQAGVSRQRLFWAGLAEQSVGVVMPITLGGVLYLAAVWHIAWLCLALSLPLLAVAGIRLLHRLAEWLPWTRRHVVAELPAWRMLLLAATGQLAQLLFWVALAAMLAHALFGLEIQAALGVAGAFLLAVAAGMLVVFVPGGIGVREVALVGLASYWVEMPQATFLTALLRILSSALDLAAGGVAAVISADGETE